MNRFQIDDRVMLLDDLTEENTGAGIFGYVADRMDLMKGQVLTISDDSYRGGYRLKECDCNFGYNDEWLQPYIKPELLLEERQKGNITDEEYLDYLVRGAN